MIEKVNNKFEAENEISAPLSSYPHYVDENGDIIILLDPRLKVSI
jgi:hypothetical protein